MNSGKIIRTALVALPVGLFVLGMVAVVVTHVSPKLLHHSQDENLGKNLESARMTQRPVNAGDLKLLVETLSSRIGERNLEKQDSLKKAAVWVESTLGPSNAGYPIRRQAFDVGPDKVWNVIAELRGNSRAKEFVVVGAHFDSAPGSAGVNDNGSGVAALISLARAFAGSQQARTIQFVAFVNGEPAYFETNAMGSVNFAAEAKREGMKIEAMIDLNSLGVFSDEEGSQQSPAGLDDKFPSTGNFVAILGNADSGEMAEMARDSFFRASPIPTVAGSFAEKIPEIHRADHASFSKKGFPAIVVTDTDKLRLPSADSLEQIDFEKLGSVVKGLKVVIETLANP